MGKPVLSGDSQAVRDVFVANKHIFLCQRADPTSLASAIVLLQQQPQLRAKVGRQAAELMQRDYTIEANGGRLLKHLQELVDVHGPAGK